MTRIHGRPGLLSLLVLAVLWLLRWPRFPLWEDESED